eukprot:Rhum_TRINITY_DN9620_c0_g1::Rhum_TRINITY_DN9620_c0_g1_i1::g.34234::m.34234
MGRGAMEHLGFGTGETVSTREGFGDRMCHAVGGVCVGIVFFLGSLALLGWNEKRAVYTAQTIDYARKEFVQLDTCEPTAEHTGKLIAFQGCGPAPEQGYAPTDADYLADVAESGGIQGAVYAPATAVFSWTRTTQQYVSHEYTVTNSKEKTKTYKYEPKWVNKPEVYHSGPSPPGWPTAWKTPLSQHTNLVCIGGNSTACTTGNSKAWLLQSSLSWDLSQIKSMGDKDTAAVLSTAKVTTTFQTSTGYRAIAWSCDGNTMLQTQVNDQRAKCDAQIALASPSTLGDFRWSLTRRTGSKSLVVSGLAQQTKKGSAFGLEEWQNPHHSGCSYCTIGTIVDGSKTGDVILDELESANKVTTWVLRFVGWLVCWVGLQLVVGPVAVVPEFIPFIGDIIGGIIGSILCCLTCIVATSLSLLVIAIAWLAYRPIIGIPLLCVFCLGVVAATLFIKKQREKKKAGGYTPMDGSGNTNTTYQPAGQYPQQNTGNPYPMQPSGNAYPPQPAGNPYPPQPAGNPYPPQPTGNPYPPAPAGNPYPYQPPAQDSAAM